MILVAGIVGLFTFRLGNRAWPFLWALMVPTHALIFWQNFGGWSFATPPTRGEVIAVGLIDSFGGWCVLAAGLLIASWVSRFRDGIAGFRDLVIPGVALLLLANYHNIVDAIIPASAEISFSPAVWAATTGLVYGFLPLGFDFWQVWTTSRTPSEDIAKGNQPFIGWH